MNFRVILDGRISSVSGKLDDELRHALNTAMGELYESLGIKDPAIMLDLSADNFISISCSVEVKDETEAVPPASDAIRSALHAADIGTSEWPEPHDPRWKVEFIGNPATEILLAA